MMKPTVRQIDLIGAVLCAGITTLAVMLIYGPIQRAEAERDRLSAELTTRRGASVAAEQARDTLHRQLLDTRDALERSRLRLRPATHVNQRLSEITGLLEDAGLVIQKSEVGTTEAHERYQTVPITLAGSGGFSDCAVFLHQLNEVLPDTGVTGVDMAHNPRSPAQPAKFRFDLVWFAAPELTAVAE